MKSFVTPAAIATLMLGLICLQPSYSDDKPAAESKTGKTATAETEKKPRLPNLYGKLNLTTEQRDKALAVQAKYADQIADLRAKLEKLQTQQKEELRALLDVDQQTMLAKLELQAQKRREARAAANEQASKKKSAANGNTTDNKEGEKKN